MSEYFSMGDRCLSSTGAGANCALPMRVILHPRVQNFHPVLGLGSEEGS